MTEPKRFQFFPSRLALWGFVVLVALQAGLGFWNVADAWTRGHNGYNGSAYHQSARNSLRWDLLFPLQYHTGVRTPSPDAVYTHHPLAMHLHNTASVWLFGDHPASIRGAQAVQAMLAVAALFFSVQHLWSTAHALLAGFVFIASPINAIYLNMANHSSGFFAWSIAALLAHIARQQEPPGSRGARRWYLVLLVAYAGAALWDWPAVYVATAIFVHWAYVIVRARRSCGAFRSLRGELWALAGFCGLVVSLLVGHFGLVVWTVGGLHELLSTAGARQHVHPALWRHNIRVVPALMFTAPILLTSALWLVSWGVRALRRRAHARDLLPLSFAGAGIVHYLVFKSSAIVHSYWAWNCVPFVAIAVSTSVWAVARYSAARWASGDQASRRGWVFPTAASVAMALTVLPLTVRAVELTPAARSVGGSMWFVSDVRLSRDHYDSGRPELRLAEAVRGFFGRRVGVLLHAGMERRRLEPRFNITLDRELHVVQSLDDVPPAAPVAGWVMVGAIRDVPREARLRWAAHHPYWEWDEFFIIDRSTDGPDVRAYRLEEQPMDLWYAYFVNSWEPPVRVRRDPARERALREAIPSMVAEP